ncbi:F-box protein CPR1-like [Silene latifolia]|uniref:F-box protein CPR1-like n=1 Tax=Silene latifolia TaxID=37657 RepID=UPI003D78958F
MKIIVTPIPNDQTPSVMALLPVDILYYNILTKIRAKSLLRFKCVCKDWYNLINSSNFRNIQHKHTLQLESRDSSDFLVVSDTYGLDSDDTRGTIWPLLYTYLDAPNYTSGINRKMEAFEVSCHIVGSSNGLICLQFEGSGFSLCNPVTREYSRLIKSPLLASDGFLDAYNGFGYDVVSRDYKIVNITKFQQNCIVHVYSTGSNSWKKVQKYPDLLHKSWGYNGKNVIVNNKLHWIMLKNDEDIRTNSIFMFDLDTEEFGDISYPTGLQMYDGSLDLRVSHGRLCTLQKSLPSTYRKFSMWVMKEYGVVESWTKLYEILGKRICTKYFWMITQLSRRDREEVLLIRYDKHRIRELVWYNLETKSITGKAKDTAPEKYFGSDWLCIASLAPIPGNHPNKRHTDLAIVDDMKKEVALGYSAYCANLPMYG